MSVDLLLRALRKCERLGLFWTCHRQERFAQRYVRISDKIHKKIVERFEKMKQAGKELCLDKWVREQQENLRHLGEEM